MRCIQSIFLLLFISISAQNNNKYNTFFEKGNGNQSASYAETISFYKTLDLNFETIKMEKMGITDSGEPLHIVTFNAGKDFDFKKIHQNKIVILINNGIHAGEPDGIDATMMLFRDLALGKIEIPKNTVIVSIPVYNIGGALNRNSTSRTNQNGPEEYGFRGNARNFDLNRDLIKSDTKNTKSFVEIFHKLNPEIFIDNHVSNGADYQYNLTYIQTQHNKLGKVLGDFMINEMTPKIIADLKTKKQEATPYVNVWNGTPDKGFGQFSDSPRYTTGYTSLFSTIGYVVETHILKNYAIRVKATYDFMLSTIKYAVNNIEKIKNAIAKNKLEFTKNRAKYPTQWELDTTKIAKMNFLGYEGSYKKSDVTTGQRLFYDQTKPYKKEIKYYTDFKAIKFTTIPKAYIIPKGWWNVIELLKNNSCNYSILKKDSIINVESYKICDYKTATKTFEGHYNHYDTSYFIYSMEDVKFNKGDFIFYTNQPAIKYLLETLEPEAIDSFFNWNFFDTILQQKEGFSDYVFEDSATKFLNENPEIKAKLKTKMETDAAFAKSPEAQLDWVYKQTPHYEKPHLQYPVYRIMN